MSEAQDLGAPQHETSGVRGFKPDAQGAGPTHLLTMARGAPDAIPQRLVPALKAMGISTCELPGQGLGLSFDGEVLAFLTRDPFCLTELPTESVAEAAEPEPPADMTDDEALADPDDPLGAEGVAEEDPGQFENVFDSEPESDSEPEVSPEPPIALDSDPEPEVDHSPEENVDPEEDLLAEEEMLADEDRLAEEPSPDDSHAEPSVEEPEPEPAPTSAAQSFPDLDLLNDRLARIEAAMEAQGALVSGVLARMDERSARIEDAITALATRPAPALNLTAQQRSFAAFGAAMATFQSRIGAFADRIEEGQARFVGEIQTLLQAEKPAAIAPEPSSHDIEVQALSMALSAISEELAAARSPSIAELSTTLEAVTVAQDRVVSMLLQMNEVPDTRIQAAQEEFLRDIRVIIAELLAENRRAAVA